MPHERDTTAASESSGRPARRLGAGPRGSRGGGWGGPASRRWGTGCRIARADRTGWGRRQSGRRGQREAGRPGRPCRPGPTLEEPGMVLICHCCRWNRRFHAPAGFVVETQCDVEGVRPVEVGAVGLTAEPVPQPAADEQREDRPAGQRDEEQHLAVRVGVHRQPHRFAERQSVGGAQRHVDGDALGEVHLDRNLERQEAGRQLDHTHVGDGHARRRVYVEPDPDRHGQVVAQRERQRTAFGRQCVGAAGVDDRDRIEEVVDRAADCRETLLRKAIAGIGWHRLAQCAQRVLAQGCGVSVAGEAGALVGCQRRSQVPTAGPSPRQCRIRRRRRIVRADLRGRCRAAARRAAAVPRWLR